MFAPVPDEADLYRYASNGQYDHMPYEMTMHLQPQDYSFDANYRMDPLFYTQTNGLPSESKLSTYLSRQNVTTPPNYGLSSTSGLSKVSLIDSPISLKKVQVSSQSPEFIPARLSSPNFYSPYSNVISNGLISNNSSVASTGTHSSNNSTPLLNSGVSYTTTPIKGRSLMRDESPQTVGDSPKHTPRSTPPPSSVPTGIHQENVGGTTYFYPASSGHTSNQSNANVVNGGGNGVGGGGDTGGGMSSHIQQPHHEYVPRPGHMYPGPASCILNMQPKTQLSSAFFIPDELRNDVLQRNEIANMMDLNPNPDLPEEIENNYHSLFPLESSQLHPKLPSPSSTYRAINSNTGAKYCIRRLHGMQVQSAKCMTIADLWKKVEHSNVVHLKEIFTTKSFNDRSLVLIYDYHPGSQTLLSKYFTPTPDANGYSDPFQGEARPFSHKSNMQRTQNGPLLNETEIWTIVMQLTAGLRAIHQAGLACRTLDPTKIIVTGKRVRFSFVGISDIASYETILPNYSQYQQEDLTSLGKLILALACRCLHSVHEDHIQSSINNVARNYSTDLRNLLCYLLTPSASVSGHRCVTDLMPMIGARFYTQLDALQSKCDVQEDELAKELENGRLYRLVVKLGTINERPELSLDGTWSETGDRYMLKLFRDYLFHSVTDDGRPWLDHAHIVQCLNKMDAGTMEKVNLMSRDEQSILVVTYAELKHCLEQAFSELCL